MHRLLLRAGVLITFGMLTICTITGCSNDDSPEEVVAPLPLDDDIDYDSILPIAETVEVDPDPRFAIFPDTQFALNFDQGVAEAKVNNTPATGAGLHWKWRADRHLPYGSIVLNIEWTNRDGTTDFQTVGPYVVIVDPEEPKSPTIVRSTVINGEIDVDPAPINESGFLFDFDEPITGTIKLTDEACADLNWVGTVADQTATLTAGAEQELANNTTYKIEIDVQDGGGNRFRATITFTTKPKRRRIPL